MFLPRKLKFIVLDPIEEYMEERLIQIEYLKEVQIDPHDFQTT